MNLKRLPTLEAIAPKSLLHTSGYLSGLIRTHLWLQVVVAMILGVFVGLVINPSFGWFSAATATVLGEWLALPGQIFLAVIQMIVVPLILASIVRGIASTQDMGQLKSTGIGVVVFFLTTTVIAATIGITLGFVLQPGTYIDASSIKTAASSPGAQTLEEKVLANADVGGDFALADVPRQLTSLLPDNPLSAMASGEMLQIVIFSIILGIGLVSLKPQSSRPLLELMGSVQEVTMAIVGWVMRIAPLAVFGLLAQTMIKTGSSVLYGLGVYAAVVILGQFLLLVFYLLTVFFLSSRNPFTFFRQIKDPFLLAFSTNSSAATMPISMKSAEEELKIRPSIAQFVIPIGATANMGGTALYQALATVFMAQMFDINLALPVLIALVITTVGASIGTPAVPGVGIIVLSTVLNSAGIPLTGLALIIGLDRLLERFRTSLNVTGDLAACSVMNKLISFKNTREEEVEHREKAAQA